MRTLTGLCYRHCIKPLLFLFSADTVHEVISRMGRILGRYSWVRRCIGLMWRYEDPILEQTICGLHFRNPIGLAAGFDYNADVAMVMPALGCGYNTIGTLTHDSYQGNTPPMLGRLPKSKSLLVNKGFKNRGVEAVLSGVPNDLPRAPRGVSIGATNKAYQDFEAMVENLLEGFRDAERFDNFDYYELNISCPNLSNIKNLKEQIASPSGLKKTLTALQDLCISRPLFVKMPLERSFEEMKSLIDVMLPFSFVVGLIFSNLAKDRTNPVFDPVEVARAGQGNFSGKPVEEGSTELLRFARKTYGERFVLIGVGGVFSPEDAYQKIRAGASLVQMITGLIYLGPQQVGVINKRLALQLRKDGYLGINEAVGVQ